MLVNNHIIKEEMDQKIDGREQAKVKLSPEQAKAKEQKTIQNWNSLAGGYNTQALSKEQTAVLTASRNFYESIKKSLTLKNKYDISMRRVGPYSGDFFPHTLKENKVAMAWILRMGDNQEELKKLFPNQFYDKLVPQEVIRRPVYTLEGKEYKEKASYQPVLTVLAYLLQCESWECDSLISVKSSKPGAISKMGSIRAETERYYIDIVYSGEIAEPYQKIKVKAKTFNME